MRPDRKRNRFYLRVLEMESAVAHPRDSGELGVPFTPHSRAGLHSRNNVTEDDAEAVEDDGVHGSRV